ncbi:MAG: ABC transporter ATP-binding protein [Puniceicoccaceae bacterium]|nr:MAG: ABC transporter ATP-binding protein [Puniceicoccaceae bacterium]
MAGHRLLYSLAITTLFLSTVFGFVVPLIGSAAIDYALSGNDPDPASLTGLIVAMLGGPELLARNLWIAAAAMVGFTLVGGAFSYLKGRATAQASDGIARRLKDRLYRHLQLLPVRYHDRTNTGDLVQRCTSDVETVRQFLAVQVVELGNSAILLLAVIPIMLSLDVRMTFASLVLIPVLVVFGFVFFRRIRSVFKDVDETEGELTAVIQENLTGIRVVRAFARQDHEKAKFASPNARYRDHSLKMIRQMAWYWSLSDLVAMLQFGLVLIGGIWLISRGELTVGTLFAFIMYLNMLLWPVRQMGRVLTDLGKTNVALGRIGEVLAAEPEPPPARPAPPPPEPIAGRIRFDHLSFHHDGDIPAVRDFTLAIPAGETLAILGPSGAGKSTLIHLLLRFYDYSEGSITIDDVEINRLDRRWVRDCVSVVMQEPFLYSKTLRDNIRLGAAAAQEDAVAEAARAACIHDTILEFGEGYDTLVGERGITLSGGQRQRIALARALLKPAPILVLDDALSAVDPETESLILEALRRRRGRSTTIVIAHRLTTLAHADRIAVLDQGRLVQLGTHEELVTQPGLYRRIWEIQHRVESDLADELRSANPAPTVTPS